MANSGRGRKSNDYAEPRTAAATKDRGSAAGPARAAFTFCKRAVG